VPCGPREGPGNDERLRDVRFRAWWSLRWSRGARQAGHVRGNDQHVWRWSPTVSGLLRSASPGPPSRSACRWVSLFFRDPRSHASADGVDR